MKSATYVLRADMIVMALRCGVVVIVRFDTRVMTSAIISRILLRTYFGMASLTSHCRSLMKGIVCRRADHFQANVSLTSARRDWLDGEGSESPRGKNHQAASFPS
jgi:hypothetical protein